MKDLLQSKGILGGSTLAVVAILALLPVLLPSATLASEILIFAMAALACNLLLGYGGLLSFGQGLFFGAGSYLAALSMIHGGCGLIPALLLASAAGAVLATAVGWLSIRRTGIYFVMLTLAFSQMGYFLAYTLSKWTGGDNGLLDVPRPDLVLFGLKLADLSGAGAFYAFVAGLFLAVFVGARRVIDSPFGSTLVAIRENEIRAAAIGFDTRHFKMLAFTLSGAVTALAGALYGMLINYVPLDNVAMSMSESIVTMTIIGGTGSLLGSLLGAGALVMLGDILSAIWPRWQLLLGLALILIVIFLRGGLWGGVERVLVRFAGLREGGNKP
jgi:branched-chain amino acid transport system permease protein